MLANDLNLHLLLYLSINDIELAWYFRPSKVFVINLQIFEMNIVLNLLTLFCQKFFSITEFIFHFFTF